MNQIDFSNKVPETCRHWKGNKCRYSDHMCNYVHGFICPNNTKCWEENCKMVHLQKKRQTRQQHGKNKNKKQRFNPRSRFQRGHNQSPPRHRKGPQHWRSPPRRRSRTRSPNFRRGQYKADQQPGWSPGPFQPVSRSPSPPRRSRSRSRSRYYSTNRPRYRSRSRSRFRSRSRSQFRSKSRSPFRSRSRSQHHSRSRSPQHHRSQSQHRSRSYNLEKVDSRNDRASRSLSTSPPEKPKGSRSSIASSNSSSNSTTDVKGLGSRREYSHSIASNLMSDSLASVPVVTEAEQVLPHQSSANTGHRMQLDLENLCKDLESDADTVARERKEVEEKEVISKLQVEIAKNFMNPETQSLMEQILSSMKEKLKKPDPVRESRCEKRFPLDEVGDDLDLNLEEVGEEVDDIFANSLSRSANDAVEDSFSAGNRNWEPATSSNPSPPRLSPVSDSRKTIDQFRDIHIENDWDIKAALRNLSSSLKNPQQPGPPNLPLDDSPGSSTSMMTPAAVRRQTQPTKNKNEASELNYDWGMDTLYAGRREKNERQRSVSPPTPVIKEALHCALSPARNFSLPFPETQDIDGSSSNPNELSKEIKDARNTPQTKLLFPSAQSIPCNFPPRVSNAVSQSSRLEASPSSQDTTLTNMTVSSLTNLMRDEKGLYHSPKEGATAPRKVSSEKRNRQKSESPKRSKWKRLKEKKLKQKKQSSDEDNSSDSEDSGEDKKSSQEKDSEKIGALLQKRENLMKRVDLLIEQKNMMSEQRQDIIKNYKGSRGGLSSILDENSLLVGEIGKQIVNINNMIEKVNKKVKAKLVGLNPGTSERAESPHVTREAYKMFKSLKGKEAPPDTKPNASPPGKSSVKSVMSKNWKPVVFETSQSEASMEEEESPSVHDALFDDPNIYFRYSDQGKHWCRMCKLFFETALEYVNHLMTESHMKNVKNDRKAWLANAPKEKEKRPPNAQVVTVLLQGLEFLHSLPCFYCSLCDVFLRDKGEALKHPETKMHVSKYKIHRMHNRLLDLKFEKAKASAYAKFKIDQKYKKLESEIHSSGKTSSLEKKSLKQLKEKIEKETQDQTGESQDHARTSDSIRVVSRGVKDASDKESCGVESPGEGSTRTRERDRPAKICSDTKNRSDEGRKSKSTYEESDEDVNDEQESEKNPTKNKMEAKQRKESRDESRDSKAIRKGLNPKIPLIGKMPFLKRKGGTARSKDQQTVPVEETSSQNKEVKEYNFLEGLKIPQPNYKVDYDEDLKSIPTISEEKTTKPDVPELPDVTASKKDAGGSALYDPLEVADEDSSEDVATKDVFTNLTDISESHPETQAVIPDLSKVPLPLEMGDVYQTEDMEIENIPPDEKEEAGIIEEVHEPLEILPQLNIPLPPLPAAIERPFGYLPDVNAHPSNIAPAFGPQEFLPTRVSYSQPPKKESVNILLPPGTEDDYLEGNFFSDFSKERENKILSKETGKLDSKASSSRSNSRTTSLSFSRKASDRVPVKSGTLPSQKLDSRVPKRSSTPPPPGTEPLNKKEDFVAATISKPPIKYLKSDTKSIASPKVSTFKGKFQPLPREGSAVKLESLCLSSNSSVSSKKGIGKSEVVESTHVSYSSSESANTSTRKEGIDSKRERETPCTAPLKEPDTSSTKESSISGSHAQPGDSSLPQSQGNTASGVDEFTGLNEAVLQDDKRETSQCSTQATKDEEQNTDKDKEMSSKQCDIEENNPLPPKESQKSDTDSAPVSSLGGSPAQVDNTDRSHSEGNSSSDIDKVTGTKHVSSEKRNSSSQYHQVTSECKEQDSNPNEGLDSKCEEGKSNTTFTEPQDPAMEKLPAGSSAESENSSPQSQENSSSDEQKATSLKQVGSGDVEDLSKRCPTVNVECEKQDLNTSKINIKDKPEHEETLESVGNSGVEECIDEGKLYTLLKESDAKNRSSNDGDRTSLITEGKVGHVEAKNVEKSCVEEGKDEEEPSTLSKQSDAKSLNISPEKTEVPLEGKSDAKSSSLVSVDNEGKCVTREDVGSANTVNTSEIQESSRVAENSNSDHEKRPVVSSLVESIATSSSKEKGSSDSESSLSLRLSNDEMAEPKPLVPGNLENDKADSSSKSMEVNAEEKEDSSVINKNRSCPPVPEERDTKTSDADSLQIDRSLISKEDSLDGFGFMDNKESRDVPSEMKTDLIHKSNIDKCQTPAIEGDVNTAALPVAISQPGGEEIVDTRKPKPMETGILTFDAPQLSIIVHDNKVPNKSSASKEDSDDKEGCVPSEASLIHSTIDERCHTSFPVQDDSGSTAAPIDTCSIRGEVLGENVSNEQDSNSSSSLKDILKDRNESSSIFNDKGLTIDIGEDEGSAIAKRDDPLQFVTFSKGFEGVDIADLYSPSTSDSMGIQSKGVQETFGAFLNAVDTKEDLPDATQEEVELTDQNNSDLDHSEAKSNQNRETDNNQDTDEDCVDSKDKVIEGGSVLSKCFGREAEAEKSKEEERILRDSTVVMEEEGRESEPNTENPASNVGKKGGKRRPVRKSTRKRTTKVKILEEEEEEEEEEEPQQQQKKQQRSSSRKSSASKNTGRRQTSSFVDSPRPVRSTRRAAAAAIKSITESQEDSSPDFSTMSSDSD